MLYLINEALWDMMLDEHYSLLFLFLKTETENAEDIADDDEINLYLRARMLSSMDAMWRVMVAIKAFTI